MSGREEGDWITRSPVIPFSLSLSVRSLRPLHVRGFRCRVERKGFPILLSEVEAKFCARTISVTEVEKDERE